MTKLKFNTKILNWAAWFTLLLTYVLPYQSTDGFATTFGYPFPFITMYNTSESTSLLKSSYLNVFPLAIDILIIYFVFNFAYRLLVKEKDLKHKKMNRL